MINIIIHGCCGKMGRVVAEIISNDPQTQVVAGIDATAYGNPLAFPVFTRLQDCNITADAIIDFSTAAAVSNLLSYCVAVNTPLVLCTTGLAGEDTDKAMQAAHSIALLRSANMSLGVNLLFHILKTNSKGLVSSGFDVEILERHHNQKIDAPSGTAIALAEAVNAGLTSDDQKQYKLDRTGQRIKRGSDEIGFAVVRGGTIVGEHEVIFAGEDELITFSHSAGSKRIFAKGAVAAAKFLKGKPAGMYDMQDVIRASQ